MAGFIFGGDTKETAESLARKRAVAKALLENANSRMPQNAGEGINAIGQALAGRLMESRLDKQMATGRAATTDRFNKAVSGWGTPGATGGSMPSVTADGEVPVSSGTSFDASKISPEIRSGIIDTAKAVGIDPVDLATAISYETGGTFDPTKKGPTTQWGQHRGFIQFGEPQAAENGVDWNDPVKTQLGADGAVAKYLRAAGVKPGMGLLDVYSAINAGGVGKYGASDANNGGAPGTVADKVNKQMGGHRQNALALLGDLSSNSGGAVDAINAVAPPSGSLSDEVAEFRNTPEFLERYPGGYVQQPAAVEQGDGALAYAPAAGGDQPSSVAQALAADIPAEFQQSGQLRSAMQSPNGIVQALMAGTPATDEQVAQARTRGNAVQQALIASPQSADSGLGIDPSVMDLLSDPYLSDGQRATLETFIADKLAERKARREAEIKRADPAYRVGLEKSQLELDNLRDPKISPADQARLDLDTRKFEADQKKFEAENARGEWEIKDGRMFNKRTGEIKEVPGGKPAADFKDVTTLRKEIQGLPSYKNLSQALPIYQSMFETAGRDSRASDLNLVYGLGKIMDPNSVVREGEMVMVKNTSSLPDWLQGAIASLNGGAALTPETRRALLTEAYGRVKGYDQSFQQDIGQYRGIAQRNNMNLDDVIPSFGGYQPWEPAGDVKSTPAPEGVDQDVWDAMTPEERKLWQN